MSHKLWWVILAFFFVACENPESLMQRGNLAYRSGDKETAAAFYRRAQSIQSTKEAASFNLGKVLLEQGKAEEALQQFDQALGLEVSYPMVRVYRARSLTFLGRLDEAEEDLRRATVAQPDLGDAWLELAKLQASRSELALAIVSAEKARLDPVLLEETTLLMAEWKKQQGQLPEAIAELRALATSHSYRVETHLTLGRYLLEAGQFAEAEQRIRKGLEMQPTNAQAILDLGGALQGQGRVEEARAMYQTVIQSGAAEHPLVIQAKEQVRTLSP